MKKGKKSVILIVIVIGMLGFSANAWAQFPFYDIETFPVCYDSAGVRVTLQKVDLYVLGRDDIAKSLYFDRSGAEVVPADSLLLDGTCYEAVTDTIVLATTFESSFAGGDYTINENTWDVISIVNLGVTTQLVTVQGGAIRMLPGERYLFVSSFDEQKRLVLRNPEIEISQGVAGVNNLRVYMERK